MAEDTVRKVRRAIDILPAALPIAKECIDRLTKAAAEAKEQGEGSLSPQFFLTTAEVDALLVCVAVADALQTGIENPRHPFPRPTPKKVILQ